MGLLLCHFKARMYLPVQLVEPEPTYPSGQGPQVGGAPTLLVQVVNGSQK